MGKKFILTEEEKKRILKLYEQDETPSETPEENTTLIDVLKEMGFEESSSYIGTWEIKKSDNTYAATLNLTPDKNKISKATIVGPSNILTTIQDAFNKLSIPTQIPQDGKLITRAPFEDKELLKQISEPAKTEF